MVCTTPRRFFRVTILAASSSSPSGGYPNNIRGAGIIADIIGAVANANDAVGGQYWMVSVVLN